MAIVTEALIRDYAARDGLGLAEWVRSGAVSAAELAETAITAIERLNPQLNAVTIKAYDLGRQAAARAPAGAPFAGVPFLLKDLGSQWQGVPATASCSYLQGLPAPVDGEIDPAGEAGGLQHPRPHQRAGEWLVHLDRAAAARPYSQPLARGRDLRRLQRRVGRGGGGADGAAGRGHRRRRLDPRAGLELRPDRVEAVARPRLLRPRRGRCLVWRCVLPLRLAHRARHRGLSRRRGRRHAG